MRYARAYSGPAHGAQWSLPAGVAVPRRVGVPVPDGTAVYRLLRHHATGRPVTDYQGVYLYMPVPDRHPGAATPAADRAGTAPGTTNQDPVPEHPNP